MLKCQQFVALATVTTVLLVVHGHIHSYIFAAPEVEWGLAEGDLMIALEVVGEDS